MNAMDVEGKDLSGSGIYLILNTVDNLHYVGQSANIKQRVKRHTFELNKGKHWNKRMQSDWTRLGEESFSFALLEEVEPIRELLDRREDYWIGHYSSLDPDCGYNQKVNGKAGETTSFPCERIQIKEWTVTRRLSDGYWCVSSLCDQLGKRADNWVRLPEMQAYKDMLDFPSEKTDKGIWCHPDLVLTLAIWLSPKFYLGYMQYVRDIAGDNIWVRALNAFKSDR